MRAVRSVVIGDRRVSLWCDDQYCYTVRLEVWTEDCWQEISMQVDSTLGITAAHRRYAAYVAAAQARFSGDTTTLPTQFPELMLPLVSNL